MRVGIRNLLRLTEALPLHSIILLAIMALSSLCAMAQGNAESVATRYHDIQTLYENGKFDECEQAAKKFLGKARGDYRTNTFKILALCRLAQGDVTEETGTKYYVARLLKDDAYFTPSLDDPRKFKDIVEDFKQKQGEGITTASRQKETVEEAPVPVTLITEEMIRHSGCQTLQQLLCLYVPGMTMAEGIESNIAMHGIYSLMQDKVLIMVDGHRLNSSSTNAEAPDFRTSLDKIKQIEVLRGPASSLYGNCALTAVVNVKTKTGASLNKKKQGGGSISATIGTQHTYSGSILVGGGNNVMDLVGWGAIYNSNGFAYNVNNGIGGTNTLYAHGYNGRPSYDIGIKGRWQEFTMAVNMQRSKQVPYLNILQLPNNMATQDMMAGAANIDAYRNYGYDRYESIEGDKPGVTRSNIRIDLDFSHPLNDNFTIDASGYINFENTAMYNVMGDSIQYNCAGQMLQALTLVTPDAGYGGEVLKSVVQQIVATNQLFTQGAIQKMDWGGVTYGLQAQGTLGYKNKTLGEGSLVFGAQFELFSLSNSNFLLSSRYTAAGAVSSNATFKDGSEHSISGFLQWKHEFPFHLISSAGLRYDHKVRFNDDILDRFSPRFSLIYRLGKTLSFRGNYNYSFVDAPYIYRASILRMLGGGSDMKPETMHGFDFDVTYNNKQLHLMAEIGTFYNILNDLCVLNPKIYDSKGNSYLFVNAGKVRVIGVEGSVQYNRERFFANLNATWQRVVTSSRYIVYNSQTFSTPEFHTNLTVSGAPYKGSGTGFLNGGTLWVRGTAQFQTATYYQTLDLLSTFQNNKNIAIINKVSPQCVIGLGILYDWKHLDIDLSLNNLFNNDYKIGSMMIDGVPRYGRQFLAKVTYKF